MVSKVVVDSWRGGETEVVPLCPACGGSARIDQMQAVFDNLRTPDDDLWTYWRCAACASIFPDPRPSAGSLHAAYSRYYTHDADVAVVAAGSRSVGLVHRLVNGYMARRFGVALPNAIAAGFVLFSAIEPLRLKLDYHGRHLFLAGAQGGRVLDVGSGNGEFLLRATGLGWEAWGVDPDEAAVIACTRQGLNAVQGFAGSSAPEIATPFDVVTLRHSIEHVANPLEDLRHCLGRLRPGGMLWLAWPNPEGLGSRVFRSAWRGLEAPRHLCVPSIEAMSALLATAGFVRVRALRRGHHARSISRESARLSGYRPGWVNRVRFRLGLAVALAADVIATVSARGGEEIVMVAFAPGGRDEA